MSDDVSLYMGLQDLSGARFAEANHAGDTIDNDLLRLAQESGVALPTAGDTTRDTYHGAVVFEPSPGLHRHVSYPDYSSLYPNIIRDINMSPETLVGVGERTLVRSDYGRDDLHWSYIDPRPVKQLHGDEQYRDYTGGDYKMVVDAGTMKWRDDWSRVQEHLEPIYFLSREHQEGLLSSRVNDYIRWNKSYEGTMYAATKRVRNATYGVSGDSNFRLFDWRVAEGVTIAGRLLLNYGAETMVERLQSRFDHDDVYVTHGDTDGFGVAVDASMADEDVLRYVREAAEWLNGTGMPQFVDEQFGVPAHVTAHEVEVESYAPRLFIPGDGDGGGTKKTYAEHVTWDEGETCDEIAVTGFEMERSDIADITAEVQSSVLDTILRLPEDAARTQCYKTIRSTVADVRDGNRPLATLGKRSGISKPPEEYGTVDRRPQPMYRGAKYAKQHIPGEDQFDKPMRFPVDRIVGDEYPASYTARTAEDGDVVDWIAVEDADNIPSAIHIDYDMIVDKTLRQPLEPILRTMGWSWGAALNGHEQQTLTV